MAADSHLAMSKQFALQLQCLLNAQTWGTSKEQQTVLKILYSLENTAFSTVCSAPPSFNLPTARSRSAEAKATSARSPGQQGSGGQVSPTPFPSSRGGSRALTGSQQQGTLPPDPQ